MAFEVYEKGSAPVATVPSVTVQKRGLISLNRAAFKLLGEPPAVLLLWDSEREVIGLRGVPLDAANAYPVRPQTSNSTKGPLLVAGGLFTKFIGLNTETAYRWKPRMEDEVLCIDVGTPGAKVNSNRRGESHSTTTDT